MWRKTVKGFEESYQAAFHKATENVYEHAAFTRAVKGVERFVVQKGELVRHPETGEFVKVVEYSDGLLEKLLEARAPDKYRQKGGFQIDIRMIQQIVSDVLAAFRRSIQDTCPHCRTNLNLTPRFAAELEKLSQRFDKEHVSQ